MLQLNFSWIHFVVFTDLRRFGMFKVRKTCVRQMISWPMKWCCCDPLLWLHRIYSTIFLEPDCGIIGSLARSCSLNTKDCKNSVNSAFGWSFLNLWGLSRHWWWALILTQGKLNIFVLNCSSKACKSGKESFSSKASHIFSPKSPK